MSDLPNALRRAVPAPLRKAVNKARGKVAPWEPGAVIDPPPCPPGHVVAPPDFVGVGAQKAGTSWWYVMLLQHPDVHVPEANHKELHYFARFWDGSFRDEHVSRYHRFFPRPTGKLSGEWTPAYLAQFWVPPLLARAAPDAKVLVMLRDPVERYRSALQHVATRGGHVDNTHAVEAFARGLYGQQLSLLRASIPDDRLLALQYEQCVRDPQGQLDRTYEFVGLAPGFRPPALNRTINSARGRSQPLATETRAALVEGYRDDVEALTEAWPELDRSLWPNFR
jgi:hypothetical protein